MSRVERFPGAAEVASSRWTMRAAGVAMTASVLQLAVVIVTALATGIAYHFAVYGGTGDIGTPAASGILAGLAYVVPVFLRRDRGWYEAMANRRTMRQVALDWTVAVVIVTVIAFLTKTSDTLSRGAMLLLFTTGLASLLLLEQAISWLIATALATGRTAPRAVMIVGEEDRIDAVRKALSSRPDVIVAGIRTLPGSALAAAPSTDLETVLETSVAEARLLHVDDVVLSVALDRLDIVDRCTAAFSSSPVTIHLGSESLNRRFVDLRVAAIGGYKTLRLSRPALSPIQSALKRLLDITMATVGLLMISPLLLAVAVLIKLDSQGPVFFLQNRRGYNLRDFRILKFRTMTTMDNGDVIVQAKQDDPRITRVGAWLRRLNIDELPQLINVLKGDMSIVGPRPHAVAHDKAFEKRITRYSRRLNVRPGITGWAQVNGLRGETDTEEKMARRVEADLYYIDNWSLWLDLRILALTVLSPRAYRNAR